MNKIPSACAATLIAIFSVAPAANADPELLTGTAAYGGWRKDRPGLRRKITLDDLPAPLATPSSARAPRIVPRPKDAWPQVPEGFRAELLASGFAGPRTIRVAPNGDIFIAETGANQIRVLRASDNGEKPHETSVFASRLDEPFGIAFYPPGPEPRYVYIAGATEILRFPYKNGDLTASAPAESVVRGLPAGGHSTRDIVFSPGGETMFVSVGSASNDAENLPPLTEPEIQAFEKAHAFGASWGEEMDRADVLAFTPEGAGKYVYATGIRNCVGMSLDPVTHALWCAVNERDGLGDDLPPDYVTHVTQGAFYGWPWRYAGDHVDPHHSGERTELARKLRNPDFLIQPHSAPLGLTFYDGGQFPAEYRNDAFVALHGSWNRKTRTGQKVVRLIFENQKPTGVYEDFMTGFVLDDQRVWGRPVGVAVAKDGALLVSEDANGTIWRVSYVGK